MVYGKEALYMETVRLAVACARLTSIDQGMSR